MASTSKAQYFQTPGPWGAEAQTAGYSQAVNFPANGRIAVTAGQPGIDLKTGKLVTSSLEAQIEAAFDTVDSALKAAGASGGLATAHKMSIFYLDIRNEPVLMEIFKRRYPDTRPALLAIGTPTLAISGMHVEIQAEAVVR
jgi:enamine deaminase RidA (YjgF/YER057c/UK114 family)